MPTDQPENNAVVMTPRDQQQQDAALAEWIDKQTAAELLSISHRSIDRMIAEKRIRSLKVKRPGRQPERMVYARDIAAITAERRTAVIPRSDVVDAVMRHPQQGASESSIEQSLARVDRLTTLAVQASAEEKEQTRLARVLFLNLRDAAAVSGLPRAYLRQSILEGRLPAHRYGRRYFIHRADLADFRPLPLPQLAWSKPQ